MLGCDIVQRQSDLAYWRRLFLQSGLFSGRTEQLEAVLVHRSDAANAAILMQHAPVELALLDLGADNPDRWGMRV